MAKLIQMGDIHFSSLDEWKFSAGEHFIDWFDKYDFGPKDEVELGLAGDIAERDANPGNVMSQVYRFFDIASRKFKHVYVTIGNHDKKFYHWVETHSLEMLKDAFDNVSVYEDETVVTTENGFKLLILPFKRMDKENITLSDYYNTKLPKEIIEDSYDVIFGHWTIKEPNSPAWMKDSVDISKFNTKSWAIGHVHTRIRDEYLGSVFPNSVTEQDDRYNRGFRSLDSNGNIEFVEMPKFLQYVTIKYGEPVPEKDPNCAYSYTVADCNSEKEASEKYPDIKVRKIERKATALREQVKDANGRTDITSAFISSISDAFDEMLKDKNITLSRNTYKLAKSMMPN